MITIDFNRLGIQSGWRILDIGCGSGRHISAVMRFNNVTAIGIDFNLGDIAQAQERLEYHQKLGDHGGGVWGLAAGDILDLPFKDNCFDLVVCAEVLEHVSDNQAAAAEVVRVLKPGRNMVVSVPRYWPERICWSLSQDYHSTDNGHIRIYTKKELVDLLETAGAGLWDCHYAHSLHTLYWWLKCLLEPAHENSRLVDSYHRFLVWDMMNHPRITRLAEHLLNPLLGKSMVLYFKKK